MDETSVIYLVSVEELQNEIKEARVSYQTHNKKKETKKWQKN